VIQQIKTFRIKCDTCAASITFESTEPAGFPNLLSGHAYSQGWDSGTIRDVCPVCAIKFPVIFELQNAKDI